MKPGGGRRDASRREGDRREGGFALLVVLWTMALLSLLVANFTMIGRTETRVAANLLSNIAAEAAADGAVQEAILQLLQGAWVPDGRPHAVRIGGAMVDVRIRNEATKLNPNMASPASLQILIRRLGVEERAATALVTAIIDWRTASPLSRAGGPKLAQYQAAGLPYGPANRPFDSLDELGLVLGMTPTLLARMRPFLSVYQEGDTPDPAATLAIGRSEPAGNSEPAGTSGPDNGSGTVADQDVWHFGATGRVMVVMIEAQAVGAKGGRSARQAIVRLRQEASLDQAPYQILTWDTGAE